MKTNPFHQTVIARFPLVPVALEMIFESAR